MWRYSQADFKKASELISSTDWDSLITDNIHSSWTNWHSKFMEIMCCCIPQVVAKSKKTLPWLNKQIIQILLKRNACYRVVKKTDNPSVRCKYKSLRNKVVGLIREAKKKFFENFESADQLLNC